MSATNVSQFAQHGNTTFIFICFSRICTPKKHHEEQCVRNNVSLFARDLMHRIASVGNDNFSLFTGHILSWRGLGDRGGGGGKKCF